MPRTKIATISHFDRGEQINIPLGRGHVIDDDNKVFIWGSSQADNGAKIDINWGNTYCAVIFVFADGNEEHYPFNMNLRVNQRLGYLPTLYVPGGDPSSEKLGPRILAQNGEFAQVLGILDSLLGGTEEMQRQVT